MDSKKKILIVMGTRPEAIKLAPVIMELNRRKDRFLAKVCATAQHRQMLDQVLDLFEIKPDYDLNIMLPGQSLAQVTSLAIQGLDRVVADFKPDILLVQGDTTTAFIGALAGFYHKVRIGHVEAGLRTEDKYTPFPEEINRRLVSCLADYHFAPTENAKRALLQENIKSMSIFVTGNTVIDALLWMKSKVQNQSPKELSQSLAVLNGHRLILVTGHRRESFGQGFENICTAIRRVADKIPDTVFVYPVHLNPQVREPVGRILGGHSRILLMEPLNYAEFVWLMDRSDVVLTDSGGVQEEAPSLGKPVLVMREKTERPEGIEAGNARLVGVETENIIQGLTDVLMYPEIHEAMIRVHNPYGDGLAAKRICDILQSI